MDNRLMKQISGPIEEFNKNIRKFAGEKVRKEVMADSEKAIASADLGKISIWLKEAIDRLDTLTSTGESEDIMKSCGSSCFSVNKKHAEKDRERRLGCSTEEEYLKQVLLSGSGQGTRFEKDGNILVEYYTPKTYREDMQLRCYCLFASRLPEDMTISRTFCQCSRAHVENYWKYVLDRPVRVELGETALTGAEECKFIIHL